MTALLSQLRVTLMLKAWALLCARSIDTSSRPKNPPTIMPCTNFGVMRKMCRTCFIGRTVFDFDAFEAFKIFGFATLAVLARAEADDFRFAVDFATVVALAAARDFAAGLLTFVVFVLFICLLL